MNTKSVRFNHDQLHLAISLFISARIMLENEKTAWQPLMKYINSNKVPPANEQGKVLMIKNISLGAIILFCYALENLIKAFNPSIKKRHIDIRDIPHDLGLNNIEAVMLIRTILPLLKEGYLRYPEPKSKTNEYFIDTPSTAQIFIKFFKYFIKKYGVNVDDVKCFKVEFKKFNYPFINELLN